MENKRPDVKNCITTERQIPSEASEARTKISQGPIVISSHSFISNFNLKKKIVIVIGAGHCLRRLFFSLLRERGVDCAGELFLCSLTK